MRLDRFGTLGFAAPVHRLFSRGDGKSTGKVLPILMYHSVSPDLEAGIHPYFKVCIPPFLFAEHMRWLDELGYTGVSLSAGLGALRENSEGRKLVAITFDDGFRDFYDTACPILSSHGFSATMYLATAFIDDSRRKFKSRECLTWDEVRELQAAGFEFGSHTVNHPRLVQHDWPTIESELRASRATIEEKLGVSVRAFAYPYAYPQAEGAFSGAFSRLLASSGFESCVTTIIGRARKSDDPLRLPRLPANAADDRSLFRAKIEGGYDWMALPQALVKGLARQFRPNSRPTTSRHSRKDRDAHG